MSGLRSFYQSQLNDEPIGNGKVPTLTDKYEIVEWIAENGNSTIYIAVHRILKTKVILKCYKNTYQAEEYKILSKLIHPGIPRIIDVVSEWSQLRSKARWTDMNSGMNPMRFTIIIKG